MILLRKKPGANFHETSSPFAPERTKIVNTMMNLLNFPHNLEEMMNEEQDGSRKQVIIIKRQLDKKEGQKKEKTSIHAEKPKKTGNN